jgi:hypothetical protein
MQEVARATWTTWASMTHYLPKQSNSAGPLHPNCSILLTRRRTEDRWFSAYWKKQISHDIRFKINRGSMRYDIYGGTAAMMEIGGTATMMDRGAGQPWWIGARQPRWIRVVDDSTICCFLDLCMNKQKNTVLKIDCSQHCYTTFSKEMRTSENIICRACLSVHQTIPNVCCRRFLAEIYQWYDARNTFPSWPHYICRGIHGT